MTEQEKKTGETTGPIQTAEAKHAEILARLQTIENKIDDLGNLGVTKETPDTTPQPRYQPSPPPAQTQTSGGWGSSQGQGYTGQAMSNPDDPPTQKQLDLLTKLRIQAPPGLTKAAASQLISAKIGDKPRQQQRQWR